MGHRTLGVTAIYTEYDPAYLKHACDALDQLARQLRASGGEPEKTKSLRDMVLPGGIEPPTPPLPRECSTTELRQQAVVFIVLFLLDPPPTG